TSPLETIPSEPEYRDLVVQLTTHLLAPSTSRLSRAFLTPADVRALHDHLCDAAF
ncbi:unnamed protein product, partial [Penicillium egyptiacum]